MNLVRFLAVVALCGFLATGCRLLPPIRTESAVNLSVDKPMAAKVDAAVNTLPDAGPLLEVVIPPACPQSAGCKVAVIDVDGLLLNNDTVGPYSMGDNPVAVFQEKLTAAADPAVKAVVLRINSPGGGVAATELMARSLADFRRQTGKPVVACLLDQGAGGAYYLASGCDQIVAMPSTVVGGIGVILNLYYLEVAMEYVNVFGNTIKAGDRIDMGTPARKMTVEEKAMLTSMAKEYQNNFAQVVLHGRPRVNANSPVFDGRVMSATRAMEVGLIDGVGFLPDAVERARQLARVEAVTIVMYRRQTNPARSLYDTVPNKPMQMSGVLPVSVPGLDRSRLPLFLYLWQIEPTLVRGGGG
jgi:protease IV